MKEAFSKTSLSFKSIGLFEEKNSKQNLKNYDVIILGGGHVQTQNKFFISINLKEKIKDFEGIIIGTSAGTMNRADIVILETIEFNENSGSTSLLHYLLFNNPKFIKNFVKINIDIDFNGY